MLASSLDLARPVASTRCRNAEVLNEETTMERSQGKLLESDRLLLGEIDSSVTMKEWPGIPEWRGRFWLPDSGQVQPGGKNCLIRDDGGARELIAESFAPGATGTEVAASKDHTRFK
jgi:hypothetical protein